VAVLKASIAQEFRCRDREAASEDSESLWRLRSHLQAAKFVGTIIAELGRNIRTMTSMDTPLESQSPRRRWPWFILIALMALVGADQAFRVIKHSQVQREMEALRKEGYPVTGRELAKWHPGVPDLENAAIRIMEAARLESLPDDAFNQHWGRTEELGPDERDDLKSILTNNAAALEILHAAAQLKQSRYPVDYSRGPETLLPHLAKIKSLSQLLKAEAILNSEEGRPDLAVKSVLDGVAVARSLDSEPLLISQLVRIACLAIDCSTLERVLTQHALSEAQLLGLSEAFGGASQGSQAAFQGGFVGEICLGVYCFQMSPAKVADVMSSDGSSSSELSALTQVAFPLYAWTGLRDQDFLFYLRMMHHTLDAAKAPFPECLVKAREGARLVEEGIQANKLLIFSRMLLPALQKATDKAAENEGRLRCVQVALALERYRLQHGAKLPEQLAQLTPAILAALPADPIDGAPLRFHKLDQGYVVYSIGADGSDDGGLERTGTGSSGVRKWPPSRKSNGSTSRQGGPYDVTFTVER
jgi:hypothetical protein